MKKVYLLGLLFLAAQVSNAQKVTISGEILDLKTGEPVVGVTVYDTLSGEGSYTNAFGFFSIIVSNENTYLRFSSVGYKTTYVKANAENGPMEIKLEANSNELSGVVIQADKVDVSQEVESTQMSVVKLNPEEISKIPSLGGEVDILKVAQLMPGVAKAGEGQSGMLVRGGTADQNLVILDDATVYNLSHLFGFFSVFNNDAIRDVTIYTGGFPAQFGGRLSSVMDVRMAEGGAQKFSGKGGVGLLSSRLTLNVPIVKDKGAVMISGRRTYIDQVFKTVGVTLPYYFYDLNLKANYKLSNKDHLYLSSYFGNDVLSFTENTGNAEFEVEGGESQELGFGFQLGNFTSTLRWTHVYKEGKLFHNVTAFQTRFKYDIGGSFLDNNILIKSQIQDYGAKVDWDYNAIEHHRIKFGASFTNHGFRPNIVNTSGDITDFLQNRKGDLILSQEVGAYIVDDFKVNNRLSLNYGLRLSGSLTEGTPYGGIEPRTSAKYTVVQNHSLKFSYSRMKQYMHRVSSSSVVLPTDLWYPVTENVAPQSSHLMALGYFGGLEKWSVNYSVEGYYKYMQNLIEYKEGAQL
ncbi:MAG: TonB-dependent receptor, partial [Bacteroidetes bacterium]|nr:TonB-dependent receptor [Bacteroidota bacterium]